MVVHHARLGSALVNRAKGLIPRPYLHENILILKHTFATLLCSRSYQRNLCSFSRYRLPPEYFPSVSKALHHHGNTVSYMLGWKIISETALKRWMEIFILKWKGFIIKAAYGDDNTILIFTGLYIKLHVLLLMFHLCQVWSARCHYFLQGTFKLRWGGICQ